MPTTDALVTRAEARARLDPEFAEALAQLIEAPTKGAGTYARTAAAALNEQRQAEAVASFRDQALSTSQVQRLLRLRTPQAVHRLRSRGRLVGVHLGNATWFPAWQFAGGRLREDLPELLGDLRRFSTDAIALDRIMRLERDELGGLSIAEALDDPAHGAIARVLVAQLAG